MKLMIGAVLAAVLSLAPAMAADGRAERCLRLSGEEAVTTCSEALEPAAAVSPGRRAELLFARGKAYLSLQQYDKAADDFTAVIALDPSSGDAYIDRGVAYHHLHQYERAISDYDQAIALNANLYAAHYNRGLSYFRLGRFAEARADFDDAAQREPRDAKAIYGRGLSTVRMGGNGDADFTAAKRLDPAIADEFAREGLTP